MSTYNVIEEVVADYKTDEETSLSLITLVREGIPYKDFKRIVENSPFAFTEWADFLHLSERTIQRYKKENKSFDPLHTEKIIEIAILLSIGMDVFGDKDNFNRWLGSKSVTLGGIKPMELLDSSFGIEMVRDELGRVEHGVLA